MIEYTRKYEVSSNRGERLTSDLYVWKDVFFKSVLSYHLIGDFCHLILLNE